jgi:threonine aldolase
MAKMLAKELANVPQVKITQNVDVNGVFAIIPRKIVEKLQQEYFFYEWDPENSEVRWMTSWDTTEEDIKGFVNTLKGLL